MAAEPPLVEELLAEPRMAESMKTNRGGREGYTPSGPERA
jgi:hypothetical protein